MRLPGNVIPGLPFRYVLVPLDIEYLVGKLDEPADGISLHHGLEVREDFRGGRIEPAPRRVRRKGILV